MLMQYKSSNWSRTIIFPKAHKADRWFGVTKILKGSLINRCIKSSSQFKSHQVGPIDLRSKQGRPLSYANVVRSCVGGFERSVLRVGGAGRVAPGTFMQLL